jgi:hypothetical protein
MMNGRCWPMSKIASTIPPWSGSGISRGHSTSFSRAGAIGLIDWEIRRVGEENLTDNDITRTTDRGAPKEADQDPTPPLADSR